MSDPAQPNESEFIDADQELNEPVSEWPLRDFILAQGLLGTAIPVLLFTSEHLAAAEQSAAPGARPELVVETANRLGLNPERLTLFSDDAYLLQTALGERLLPETP